jgi:hypothetical protein
MVGREGGGAAASMVGGQDRLSLASRRPRWCGEKGRIGTKVRSLSPCNSRCGSPGSRGARLERQRQRLVAAIWPRAFLVARYGPSLAVPAMGKNLKR